MLMYNLIEYSDNYSDSSESLWGFKRDEMQMWLMAIMLFDLIKKQTLLVILKQMEQKGVKIAVPLKYLSNFWRLLEMPLVNCKVELSLKWIENCVLTTATNANKTAFEITDAKLYVPIVTLSIEDNEKIIKTIRRGI